MSWHYKILGVDVHIVKIVKINVYLSIPRMLVLGVVLVEGAPT